jgi:DNA-binding transcriptional MerR regulator
MGERTLSIRQLAQEAGVSTKTLRYWETQGLLAPAGRTHTNYRRYTETHVERALFIRKAQSLGFTLAEIRHIFDLARSQKARRWSAEKKPSRLGPTEVCQCIASIPIQDLRAPSRSLPVRGGEKYGS